jgi:hypothetical protein
VIVSLAVVGCGGSHPTSTTPAVAKISLGSFYANSTLSFATLHGPRRVTLQISAGCGERSSLNVMYSRTRGGAVLSQDYSGRPRGCRFTRDLNAGQLSAHWGRHFAFRLTLALEGTPTVRSDRAGSHCHATDTTRTYRVAGSLAARVHPRAYGDFDAPPSTLTVDTIGVPPCAVDQTGSGAYQGEFLFEGPSRHRLRALAERSSGDELTGFRGNTQLDARQASGVLGGVDLSATGPDHLAPGVIDNLSLGLPEQAFTARASDLRTARIDGASPFSSGSMTYVSGAGCTPSADATLGTLHGAIRIDEPGAVRLTVTGHEVGPTELEGPHVRANECPILTG